MKELLKLIKNYEERNNFCISVIMHGDGSGHVSVFTEESGNLFCFDTTEELESKLLTRIDN